MVQAQARVGGGLEDLLVPLQTDAAVPGVDHQEVALLLADVAHRAPGVLRHRQHVARAEAHRDRVGTVERDLPLAVLDDERLGLLLAVLRDTLAGLGAQPGDIVAVRVEHARVLVRVLGHAVADDAAQPRPAARQGAVDEGVLRPHELVGRGDPALHLLGAVVAQPVDVLLRHRRDPLGLRRQLVPGGGVDELVVGAEVQAVLCRLAQDRGAPDDAAGPVMAEHGEQPAVVRTGVGEAAEDPGGDGRDVPGLQEQFTFAAVGAPAQQVLAFGADEHLGGVVQVQVVGDAVRHGGGADVVAVRQPQVDVLAGGLRDARPDHGVVLLPVRAGRTAVDEGLVAGDEVAAAHRAALKVGRGHDDIGHGGSLVDKHEWNTYALP